MKEMGSEIRVPVRWWLGHEVFGAYTDGPYHRFVEALGFNAVNPDVLVISSDSGHWCRTENACQPSLAARTVAYWSHA